MIYVSKTIGNSPICWTSKKQTIVATSTNEAENISPYGMFHLCITSPCASSKGGQYNLTRRVSKIYLHGHMRSCTLSSYLENQENGALCMLAYGLITRIESGSNSSFLNNRELEKHSEKKRYPEGTITAYMIVCDYLNIPYCPRGRLKPKTVHSGNKKNNSHKYTNKLMCSTTIEKVLWIKKVHTWVTTANINVPILQMSSKCDKLNGENCHWLLNIALTAVTITMKCYVLTREYCGKGCDYNHGICCVNAENAVRWTSRANASEGVIWK
ncbi:hypothetical protein H8356DRAFT_1361300 [Neocallimastix lanati (nom. inval.)]|nr:hypothetical protein H8356DRAFT_1361300 [Neocallimastix sp. JGI-2020a]